jgi:hypothetical protein
MQIIYINQSSRNYGPWTKPSPLPIFVNKILLDHIPICSMCTLLLTAFVAVAMLRSHDGGLVRATSSLQNNGILGKLVS